MAVPIHKTGLNKTLGQKSSAIYSTNLIGNFDPTAGIASTHWTNQAASNALRRYNGITFNTSTPKNFQFDGTNDFLGEASSGYGGTAFTMDTDSAFTVAQWYKHKLNLRHIAFDLIYGSADIVTLSTAEFVLNKYSAITLAGRVDFDYTFSNDTWYYIALVYDGSNGYSFYVNGSFVGSGTVSTGSLAGLDVQIGKLAGNTFTQSGIKVGNVHAYSSALGSSELRQNFLATQSINNLRRYGNNYTA
tara:strand:- start:47 stop:784 length:738 start_codon:yes stop_codon:yes gene_type:complete